jgi:uncharacterized protein YfaS (alpha-2-macroglobulin family)
MANNKNWKRFLFGFYTPPGWILLIKDKLSALVSGGLKSLGAFKKAHRRCCTVILAGICGVVIFLVGFNFFESRKPQRILLNCRISEPANALGDREALPLAVSFNGSAAPVDLAGKEVTRGITINPPISGSWRWDGDDLLVFTADRDWSIGKKYTISFTKDFFPPHIQMARNISFTIEDFKISAEDGEFYIDPEDGSLKRVLATVRANYPMDTSSLENNIVIEPDIKVDSGALKKKRYAFTVNYNRLLTEAYIVSEALGVPAKSVSMRITINRGVRAASGEGSPGLSREQLYVEIPGFTNYVSVTDADHELVQNEGQKYDQVFILSTQGTIDEAEFIKNISAWELPRDKPELPGSKGVKNYRWDNPDEMVAEVLALARKLEPEPIPNELKYSSVNSFKFSAEPGRYVYVKFNNGAKFFGGYVLNQAFERIFQVEQYPKEISILSEGSILSFSGDKRLSLLTRGVRDIKFTIGRIRPDDINHLVSQSGGDMTGINFNNYTFDQYNITEQYTEETSVSLASDRDFAYFSFDFSKYLENIPSRNMRHGLFIFTVSDSNNNYLNRRLIMVSDLGFFVKAASNGTRDVFVQSVATGDPVAGAAVSVLGLNGNPVVSTYTAADGRVQFPVLSEYRDDQEPTVYTVRFGEDMSFMPYSASGRNLDYSSFDVGGIQGASDPNTLQAFLFSDRGIYRPGDEVRIGMAVKSGDWKIGLEGTPLEWQVTDPRGASIYSRRIRLSPEGVEELTFSTQDWSPTGTYMVQVYVIRETGQNRREELVFLGSQTLRVEEFLPDTLTVSAVFAPLPREGWINPSALESLVTVRNLFGTPAVGNEVKARINLTPGNQYFRQYQDYRWSDPYLAKNSYQEYLGSQNTGTEGTAAFSLNLSKFAQATYRLSFYAEAFEKGSGRNVSAETSVYVSPLAYLIGYRADGSLGYIQKDTVRRISLIAINPGAEKTAVPDLNFILTELRYVSILVRQPNGVYKYQSVQKEFPVSAEKVTIPAAGLEYDLPTAVPGEYRLTVTGADDLEYNRVAFSVAGNENLTRSLNRTAELEITLNKNDFIPGEDMQLMIKAPYAGSGLITIERDKVYAFKWFRSSGETTTQTITVPAALEGNGYVNVQYTRSQDSPEIFMSPLSYGAVPFSISKENRTNPITLDIPGEAKPDRDFTIKYSTPRRGKIILYAVDEGILQLAGYRTPDPLGFFFQKRALEVRTSQIMNLILPRYSVVQSLSAMGGGAGYDELSRNLNPFKRRQNAPVAYWSGIVDSGPEIRELTYKVPDYFNGTLRVMAVSVSPDAVGAGEDRSLIRSTFIISPNAPMMAAPGDEFEISLTVTNNQRGAGEAGKVHLQAAPSPHLVLTGNNEFDLSIPEGRDQTLSIPVKAAGPLGAAELRFTASNGGETSELAAYLSVRPAVPYRVSLYSGAIKNKAAEVAIDRRLYEEFHTRDLSLSYLPLGIAKGLNFYLETYPYGCSEQLISAAFPFLYPQLFRELGFTRAQAEESIYRVMGILQARMKDDGSIGMWTLRSDAEPLITVYAAHFLTEAGNAGYYVAPGVMQKLLQALRDIAGGSGTTGEVPRGSSLYELSARSYAVYVLTLNEVVTTPLLESLKQHMSRDNRGAETGFPGLYLAGTYALLQKKSDASALLARIRWTMNKDASLRYIDDLMFHAVYLNITARHFPERLRDVSESLLESMAEFLENQEYTTLSANYALMAIDAYLKAVPGADTGRFTALEIVQNNQNRELKPVGTNLFTTPFSTDARKIRLENKDPLTLFYQITAAGFDRELPQAEIKNGVEVYREFLDEAGKVITAAKVGDTVIVRLNFRSLSNQKIWNMAVVDLLPAGLEADIESIRNASGSSWQPDYTDIREDRIVVYGTIGPRVSSFSYRTRAINSGSFTVPPLFAEAMYDRSVWTLRPQESLRINK